MDGAIPRVMNKAERLGESLHDDCPAFIHVFDSRSMREQIALRMLLKNSDFWEAFVSMARTLNAAPGQTRCAQIGKRSFASQPEPMRRFSSVNAPPCASAICRLSTRPIPDPPGLVVKNGTNRLPVLERPGPSSSTLISI